MKISFLYTYSIAVFFIDKINLICYDITVRIIAFVSLIVKCYSLF